MAQECQTALEGSLFNHSVPVSVLKTEIQEGSSPWPVLEPAVFSPGCHGCLLPFGHALPLSCCSQLSTHIPQLGQVTTGWAAAPAVLQPSPVPVWASALAQ